MRLMGVFTFPSEDVLFHGTRVILRTLRGQEAGEVLCEANPDALAHLSPGYEENRIVRTMTPDDEKECRQIRLAEKDEFQRAKVIIERLKLTMDLVRVEHLFGGERLIVYYVADERVDFRDLVRVLAAEFQTRIEMRQIGARDETKLLADIGDCGREVCCNTYLVSMFSVQMKMAKLQKATLDPTKISGRCGRLKCCLRYEYEVYTERLAMLPAIGSWINTPAGPGQVIAQELLAKRLLVELDDRTRKNFTLEEIRSVEQTASPPTAEEKSERGNTADFDESRPSPTEKPRRHRHTKRARPPRSGQMSGHSSGPSAPPPQTGESGRGFEKKYQTEWRGTPKKTARPENVRRPHPKNVRRPRPEGRDRGFRNRKKESE
jgi:cell fate regulator YaaT (PSP1 superfamily)